MSENCKEKEGRYKLDISISKVAYFNKILNPEKAVMRMLIVMFKRHLTVTGHGEVRLALCRFLVWR